METKYVPLLDITVGRLTYRRVSDILDQCRGVHREATRKAIADLPPLQRKIIKARANLAQHPRRVDIARALGLSEDRARELEREGLAQILDTLRATGKVTWRW